MGTFALRLTNATKTYLRHGHRQAVFQGISLSLAQGEILALLGQSGCGKSTLLRVLSHLEPLNAGTIETAEHGRLSTGLVFQDALLLPWLTVAENVALGLRFQANRRAADQESVPQLLQDFGIADLANAYPDELSGGQAQRASLARTLVTRPSILLLDEPFAALDPRTRAALQQWLLDVIRTRNLTALIVTHDVDEAMYLGDRIALMAPNPGRITRVWDCRHLDAGHRDTGAGLELRREILASYHSDSPRDTGTEGQRSAQQLAAAS